MRVARDQYIDVHLPRDSAQRIQVASRYALVPVYNTYLYRRVVGICMHGLVYGLFSFRVVLVSWYESF